MADSSGIRAGLAYYELSLKDGKLTKGLRAWKGKLAAFGASVKAAGLKLMGIGAAMAAPLAAATAAFGNTAKEMAEAAEKSGVAVEQLSTLKYAAEQCGVGFDELQNGLKKMQQKLGEAEQGNGAAIESFAKLGVNINDLKGLSADKQMEVLADKIASIQDPALRTAATMEIFGKSGADLIPLLAQGAAGIERYIAKAKELGLQMSTEDVKAGMAFQQSLQDIWDQIKMVAFQIGAALKPALDGLAAKVTKWLSTAIKWIKSHRDVVVVVAKVVAGIVAAGAAVYGLGTAFSSVGSVLGGLSSVLSVAGTALGVAVSVIGTILSPIGLVAAAVVGLGVVWEETTGGISAAVGTLSSVFDGLKSDALASFAGIRNALMAGDIGLAAKIVWLTVKAEFQSGLSALEGIWADLKADAQTGMEAVSYAIGRVSIGGWTEAKRIWGSAITFLLDLLSVLSNKAAHIISNAFLGWKIAWIQAQEALGLMKEGAAHAAINQAKRDAAGNNAASDKKTQEEIAARDKAAAAEDAKLKGELNAQQRKALDDLKKEHDATNAEIAKRAADAKADAQADVSKAKLALRAALFDAAEEAKQETRESKQDAQQKHQQQQDAIVNLMRGVQAGTFSAATAARQLGGTNLSAKQGGGPEHGGGPSWSQKSGAHWAVVNLQQKQLEEQRKANALLAKVAQAVAETGLNF